MQLRVAVYWHYVQSVQTFYISEYRLVIRGKSLLLEQSLLIQPNTVLTEYCNCSDN